MYRHQNSPHWVSSALSCVMPLTHEGRKRGGLVFLSYSWYMLWKLFLHTDVYNGHVPRFASACLLVSFHVSPCSLLCRVVLEYTFSFR